MKILLSWMLLIALLYADYQNIGNAKLQELKTNGITIIDIRTQPEWDYTGVIGGSTLITSHTQNGFEYERFKSELKKQGIKNNFVLVCRSGNRSKELAERLNTDGYKNFYNLEYGMNYWLKENRKTSKDGL